MKEKIKKLDTRLGAMLWIAWVILLGVSYLLAVRITAPEYETVSSIDPIPYEYQTEDGDRIESTYYYTWYHKDFKSPKAILYDPQTDRTRDIKDEYYHKAVTLMGESQYNGIIHHAKWVWFAILTILCSILAAIYGDRLRDRIVCNRIKKKPDFLSCTYFLYSDRSESTKKEIRNLIPLVADAYIASRKSELEKKFSPKLFNLVMLWLGIVKSTGSTTIYYRHYFEDKLIDQKQFLSNYADYLKRKRGIIPGVESSITYTENCLCHDYIDIPKLANNPAYAECITSQLNKLFAEIMGSEIFKFASSTYNYTMKVRTYIRNSTTYFSWDDKISKGKKYPGTLIEVSIDRFILSKDGEDNTMWNCYLEPVSTYKSTEDDFNLTDFYTNMVVHTLDNLKDTFTAKK